MKFAVVILSVFSTFSVHAQQANSKYRAGKFQCYFKKLSNNQDKNMVLESTADHKAQTEFDGVRFEVAVQENDQVTFAAVKYGPPSKEPYAAAYGDKEVYLTVMYGHGKSEIAVFGGCKLMPETK